MNWDQFKDPVCCLCLVGGVVTSWSLTQELAVTDPAQEEGGKNFFQSES